MSTFYMLESMNSIILLLYVLRSYVKCVFSINVSEIWQLTHWGWVTHICVCNLTIIGLDNGLSPSRRQAIIWNNGEQLLIGPLRTNLSIISIEILTFSFKKMRLYFVWNMAVFLSRPQWVKSGNPHGDRDNVLSTLPVAGGPTMHGISKMAS